GWTSLARNQWVTLRGNSTEALRWKEITHIISLLEEQDFVEWIPPDNYFLRLKTKGTKAAQIGLKKYFIQQEEKTHNRGGTTHIDNRNSISGNTIVGSTIQQVQSADREMGSSVNGFSKIIFKILIGIIVALISGYLLYKFGWRK
ncbi:MAG: hypothetical protein ABI763_13170, partial [Bacteroidota bacterium]